MSVKSQTLSDYHNHILRLINREINRKQHHMGKSKDVKEYWEISSEIEVLENIKDLIHWDWVNSNYSKCGDVG